MGAAGYMREGPADFGEPVFSNQGPPLKRGLAVALPRGQEGFWERAVKVKRSLMFQPKYSVA